MSRAWPDVADPFEIPIFILNFNQLASLRQQVRWLIDGGYKRICIVDNKSTYQPLLDYYDSITEDVQVIRLEANLGNTALWDASIIERLGIDGPFVYTDADIVPDDECPNDLVAHLVSLLNQHPHIQKVGPALRIDNLPDTYRFKQEVLIWEGQFWQRPIARGLFMAPIDTTLALYRPHSTYIREPALRTGWPYVARHAPWYADSSNPTEEQKFYAETAQNTHWTRAALPEWLGTSTRAMRTSPKALLHLGCGHELIPGWINLDVQRNVGADIVYDLNNCAKEKLPLANDSIDGFFMCHVFEHIDRTLSMMEELHRVARAGAKMILRLPHGASDDAVEDPTHRRACFPNSFVYFTQPAYSRADYGYLGGWQLDRVKLVVDPGLLQAEGEARVLERARTERNVVMEMVVELSAVKPPRARELRLLRWAQPTASGSVLDEETDFGAARANA